MANVVAAGAGPFLKRGAPVQMVVVLVMALVTVLQLFAKGKRIGLGALALGVINSQIVKRGHAGGVDEQVLDDSTLTALAKAINKGMHCVPNETA